MLRLLRLLKRSENVAADDSWQGGNASQLSYQYAMSHQGLDAKTAHEVLDYLRQSDAHVMHSHANDADETYFPWCKQLNLQSCSHKVDELECRQCTFVWQVQLPS